jgi:hypothetical protein
MCPMVKMAVAANLGFKGRFRQSQQICSSLLISALERCRPPCTTIPRRKSFVLFSAVVAAVASVARRPWYRRIGGTKGILINTKYAAFGLLCKGTCKHILYVCVYRILPSLRGKPELAEGYKGQEMIVPCISTTGRWGRQGVQTSPGLYGMVMSAAGPRPTVMMQHYSLFSHPSHEPIGFSQLSRLVLSVPATMPCDGIYSTIVHLFF